MDTYKLTKGYKPGCYGPRMIGLTNVGNELPDATAERFLDLGIIEREDIPKTKRPGRTKKERG